MSNSASTADPFSRRLRDHGSLATSLSIAMLLAACGGGGGTSSSGRTPSLNLSGTAATGAALAGANVQIKCAAGTGGVTTGADGSFSVVIAGAALPCVLEVSNVATTLHSAVESGAGESVKANITPLTELLIAKITGADPATLFAAFDAAAQAKLSAAAIDAARASLTSALQGAVDLSGVDPLKDRLAIGNPQDQLLDTLATVLATAQTTLQELTSAVAASGATNSLVTALLQPAAAHCAALHSGKYRVINPKMADIPGAPADPPHLLDIDATTLMVTNDLALLGELALAITPVDGAPCKFASVGDYGPETSLVAKSGVMVWRSPTSTGQIAS